jgi:cytochrome P450
MQVEIALATIFQRFHSLNVSEQHEWLLSPSIRGLRQLVVTFS